jgi:chorismate mutase
MTKGRAKLPWRAVAGQRGVIHHLDLLYSAACHRPQKLSRERKIVYSTVKAQTALITRKGLDHTMLKINWTLATMLASTITATGPAHSQHAGGQLQSLVETSASRLVIAKQVALAKWDDGTAVEDAPREAKVITGAVKDGESVGLEPASVANFFRAQIEANKLVQYSLLADWRRSGKAPAHTPINLVATIRPQLDQVQKTLIGELKDTVAVRASTTCPADVAKAVGKYVSEHKPDVGPLEAMALGRAMAATCTS